MHSLIRMSIYLYICIYIYVYLYISTQLPPVGSFRFVELPTQADTGTCLAGRLCCFSGIKPFTSPIRLPGHANSNGPREELCSTYLRARGYHSDSRETERKSQVRSDRRATPRLSQRVSASITYNIYVYTLAVYVYVVPGSEFPKIPSYPHYPLSRPGAAASAGVRVVHLGRSTCHAIIGRGVSQQGFRWSRRGNLQSSQGVSTACAARHRLITSCLQARA